MASPEFPLPLYHGTSTLFLPDILRLGLGGMDPLVDLSVHRFVRELDPLIQAHLTQSGAYAHRHRTWARMVSQTSAA